MSGSLQWLWNTVGATCCWALSDIICDTCIGPADAPTAAEEAGPNGSEVCEATTSGARKRPLRGTQPHQPCAKTESVRLQSRLSPSHKPSPKVPHGDAVTAGLPPAALAGDARQKLTPEQNALVSGFVSLLTALVSVLFLPRRVEDMPLMLSGSGLTLDLGQLDRLGALATIGGFFHFTAYLSILCAFSSVSSTVITPLMQLSAVWMLPLSTLAATLGLASIIRPVHLLSVALICAGGFLPAAGGHLSLITSRSFWKQKCIRYVSLGELLFGCYNLVMHQATFAAAAHEASGQILVTLRFFLISRVANGLTCMGLFASIPSLRKHAVALLSVRRRFLFAAFLGECLSMMGVCLVTFSYSSFYEPSVVNAVEGGLQQLFNLLFALISHRALGVGRKVDLVHVKVVSFLLVSTGLALSTV